MRKSISDLLYDYCGCVFVSSIINNINIFCLTGISVGQTVLFYANKSGPSRNLPAPSFLFFHLMILLQPNKKKRVQMGFLTSLLVCNNFLKISSYTWFYNPIGLLEISLTFVNHLQDGGIYFMRFGIFQQITACP